MYSLHLTAEQREIRDAVRDFVAQEIRPVALKSSRLEAAERSFPPEILAKASQMGLRTLALSEELGGAGADNLTSCIVAEALAAGDVDVAHTLVGTSMLAHTLFDVLMTPEQRERFLPQFLADDHYHLAYAERERGADTALGAQYHRGPVDAMPKTTALRGTSGDWVISGTKSLVINAPLAKLFAVPVAMDVGGAGRSTGMLLVPRDTAGMTVREPERPRGWYHGVCAEVTFENCRVGAENAIAPERIAAAGAGAAAGRGSPLKEAMNIGVGQAAFDAAVDYAKLRIQGGRRIIEHQAIGTLLAECAVRLSTARNAVWQAAWASDHPEAVADQSLDDVPLQRIAEVFTAEAMHRVALDAADCFGAMGVMRDMPLTKYVRDALIFLHSGNGVADTKLRIAEAVAGYERKAQWN
jgi:alkylation response protein AidB-like acyl-CoA dehydrogenase